MAGKDFFLKSLFYINIAFLLKGFFFAYYVENILA